MAVANRQNPIRLIRNEVEERLKLLPYRYPGYSHRESPTEFWQRVEQSGQLLKALALFDQLAAEERRKAQVPRETKKMFTDRVEREGRRDEVERVRAELLASGLGDRIARQPWAGW
jgi:hypothetical protein